MKRLAWAVLLAGVLLAAWTGLVYAQVVWEWHEGDDCNLWTFPCRDNEYAVANPHNEILIPTTPCTNGVVSISMAGGVPGYIEILWNGDPVITDIQSSPVVVSFTTVFRVRPDHDDELQIYGHHENPILNEIHIYNVVADCQDPLGPSILEQILAALTDLIDLITNYTNPLLQSLNDAIQDLIAAILGLGGKIDALTSTLATPAYSPIAPPDNATAVPTTPPVVVTDPGQLTVLYLPIVAKGSITATKPLNWLTQLNLCRSLAGQSAVAEDLGSSYAAAAHAVYLVRNDETGHEEDSMKPGYSAAGAEAGMRSDILTDGAVLGRSDESAVQEFCTNPFYLLGLLDPRLSTAGYGSALDGAGTVRMAAVLDVSQQGNAAAWPVRFPGSGQTVPPQISLSLTSTQLLPDPRPGCDLAGAAGLPILLLLGHTPMDLFVSDSSLTRDGNAVDHCIFSDHTYLDFNSDRQYLGRYLLGRVGGIVLLPAAPLTAGSYTVSITANETVYTWSFTVQ